MSPASDAPRRFSAKAAPIAKPLPLWILYPLFFVSVYLSHLTLLHLPYFWDEAGYYIPAALDFFHTGTLIPVTTLTNAHPPLPSILLAGWWHLSGGPFIGATRTLICMVSAAALLGAFRLARTLASAPVAIIVTLLTALYPVWFAQSTLAHADIFAAAFTLWALSFYFQAKPQRLAAAALFSLAALSKETAIVTPVALALWEVVLLFSPEESGNRTAHRYWILALAFPLLPLGLWYGYHHAMTGFTFGNPEFLRYNATANLGPTRILLSLWHRTIHLTLHMNMYVPVALTLATLLLKPVRSRLSALYAPALPAIIVILLGNLIAFSVLGGALLTRYLLPMFPLVLLLCVSLWHERVSAWPWCAGLSATAFIAGLWINPPYAFAPEDNLTYRDMIVLHQQAISLIAQKFPAATVLTAWPATSELTRPELGYTRHPFAVTGLENFTSEQLQKAAQDPGGYDTALLFSTKWAPDPRAFSLSRPTERADTQYFAFHRDLQPAEAAALLHGEIVWQSRRKGEWIAVLHFPRAVQARLLR